MLKKSIKNLPTPHKWLISVVVGILFILMLLPSEPASAYKNTTNLEIGKRYNLNLDASNLPKETTSAAEEQETKYTFTVKSGDNLAIIFKRAGLSPQETYRVSKAGKLAKKLLKIMPGESLELDINSEGKLDALFYSYSATDTLVINKDEQQNFVSSIQSKTVDTRINYAQGEISNSLWNAGRNAKLSDNQIMSLAGIFGWDIDFALELRAGDSFYVMFEERFIDGEFAEHGDIIAAQFVNQGETYSAIRYSDGSYYTPEGRSMRKSFLRAPVNFKYISSNFNPKRFHPIQKRVKPHNGTDYRANTGTPVVAAGDGKVTHSTYNKYNGHYVFIQHSNNIVTKYLHFSKRAVKKGQKVSQGQVIGYVGSTGMSQAPHLHYEFLVNGVHRNPRTVSLPKAQPIAKAEKDKFAQVAEQRMQQLNNNKRIMLAML
ncbi:peptidoglycan DD-metalloendopeptidase family protein [Paraglaciecola aquimarina]|uniref:Peptidoglycan DD-metalloendopeptidase family protein n=1 Tax=Paraglaciecola algarum TaxID=3050085 RepID=A0ABS9D9G3_9ALTE|nr:peptidoglycan DD-metalloendopeptidase family protein [Paraglaciecola sp. G1-23]